MALTRIKNLDDIFSISLVYILFNRLLHVWFECQCNPQLIIPIRFTVV